VRSVRGFALLEVLAAVSILAIAGLALVDMLDSRLKDLITERSREYELLDEERLLTAWTLLTRPELDRNIGEHDVGPYRVNIQRPERTLYRIALERSSTVGVEDLVTVVYRPAAADSE